MHTIPWKIKNVEHRLWTKLARRHTHTEEWRIPAHMRWPATVSVSSRPVLCDLYPTQRNISSTRVLLPLPTIKGTLTFSMNRRMSPERCNPDLGPTAMISKPFTFSWDLLIPLFYRELRASYALIKPGSKAYWATGNFIKWFPPIYVPFNRVLL